MNCKVNEPVKIYTFGKRVLTVTSKYKLVIHGVERGKEIFVRIAKSNAAGQCDWSTVTPFIPN